jgi:hypothetical protein
MEMPESFPFTPDQELAFFGSPPLLKGEDPNKYDQLLKSIASTVEPADIFERAYVRTIVDLIWEANRYRRLVADTLLAAEQEALERLLRHLLYGMDTPFVLDSNDPASPMSTKSQSLSRQYVLKQKAAVEEVDALLATAGMNQEVVKAEAFSLRLREIESLNRLISGAEARTKTTLREIDRHRKGLGQQFRRAIEQLGDQPTLFRERREQRKHAA